MKVLLDTDVILDVLMDREPFSAPAAELLSLGESGQIEIFVTVISVSNIYYLLRKRFNHKMIMIQLKKLLSFVEICQIEKSSVIIAIDSKFKDFEDALQHFSALDKPKMDWIITRNTKDYKFSEIKVSTPQKFLDSLS